MKLLVTDNLISDLNQLDKFNIKIVEGPVKRIGATSNLLSIYCNDPDGNLIEISNVVHKS